MHLGIQSHFWLSEFHTTWQKVKKVHFWTELSFHSHGKVMAGSDTSIVYGMELQEMSWLLNNHIKVVCQLITTAAARVTALLTSHFEINVSLMHFCKDLQSIMY